MKLGLKIALVVGISSLAGGLAALGGKNSPLNKACETVTGDLRELYKATMSDPPMFLQESQRLRPVVEENQLPQIMEANLNIWRSVFAAQLRIQISDIVALDPQAETGLDAFRNNLQKNFDIERFLEILMRDVSPEALSMVTTWEPPRIFIKTRTNEPHYGIYYPEDHTIVLLVPESFSPEQVCEIFVHELIHSGQALDAIDFSATIEGVADLLALRTTNGLDINYKPETLLALIFEITKPQYIANSFTPLVSFAELDSQKNPDPLAVIDQFGKEKFKKRFLKYVHGPKKSPCDVFLAFYLYFTNIISHSDLISSVSQWRHLKYVESMIQEIEQSSDRTNGSNINIVYAGSFEPDNSEEAYDPNTPKPYALIPKALVIRSSIYALIILTLGFMVGRRRKE